jgi:hypothetical protein
VRVEGGKGGRGLREVNRGGKLVQSPLYASMELSLLLLMCANKNPKTSTHLSLVHECEAADLLGSIQPGCV